MAGNIVWCDIPVTDINRAVKFYSKVLGVKIHQEEIEPGYSIGVLPHEGTNIGGCLYVSDQVKPSPNGPLIYLNVSGRLSEAEKIVPEAGGKVLEPQHSIGPHGFRSLVLDSEGNRIALHSET